LWAGVSGIVSSLWTVEEKASVFLGIKLYQILLAQTEGEKAKTLNPVTKLYI
jgi:CHAT domain-containing protein